MMRSSAYNCFGVLMGTSWPTSCPRWPSLRGDVLPMITLFPSQGDFCATAFFSCCHLYRALARIIHQPEKSTGKGTFGAKMSLTTTVAQDHHDPKTSTTSRPGTTQI